VSERNQQAYYEEEWTHITLDDVQTPRSGWRTALPSAEFVQFISYLEDSNVAGRVLDLGCGGGRHSILLAQNGFEAYGIDFAESAIEQATINAAGANLENPPNFEVGTALDLPYPDDYFDVVNDDGCLHHIKPAEWPAYIDNITKVLKTNGILRVKAFSKNCSYFEKRAVNTAEQWLWIDDGGGTYFFDEADILQLFADRFELVAIDRDTRTLTEEKAFFIGLFKLMGEARSGTG
jgi:ubiquinone/menaquinone biosynthesis C-methylase UbiE